VRGGESGTRIETLAGGQNTAAIEDVEYIQKKLFAALKIPRAYLGYDEDLGAKATLAQEDIRFSRTIQRIQKTVLAELNKVAMIHLYSHGYEGEDLIDFNLLLSNPSAIAQQQKLELIRAKFEIAGTAPEGLVSRAWIHKNILGLTDDDIQLIDEEKVADKILDLEVEGTTLPDDGGGEGGEEGGGEEEGGGGEEGGGLFGADRKDGNLLIAAESDVPSYNEEEEEEEEIKFSIDDEDAPAKAQKQIRNMFNEPIKKSRRVTSGPASTHMPDFVSMTGVGKVARGQDSLNKPFDDDFVIKPFKESVPEEFMDTFLDQKIRQNAKMTNQMRSTLNNLGNTIGISRSKMLNESPDETELLHVDIDLESDSTEGFE
jgi:hypothetical protein